MPVLNPSGLVSRLSSGVVNFHNSNGVVRAELDLSGGIDSAVMLGILVDALGADKVTAIFLGINSNPDAYARAQGLADALGVKLINFDGTALFDGLLAEMKAKMALAGYDLAEIEARIAKDPTILGSIRSTLRAPWGRAANRMTGGGIRHGTGNEDEDRVLRFYQKGGDGEVDTNPIAILSKGEVYQVALELGKRLHAEDAYARIINAVPSADLWGVGEQHNDQSEILGYLRLQPETDADRAALSNVYSYINADGSYRTVGLIERYHRFLDEEVSGCGWSNEVILSDYLAWEEGEPSLFVDSPNFKGLSDVFCHRLVQAMVRVERQTRHKLNPNCPTILKREDLLDEGLITNTLPL